MSTTPIETWAVDLADVTVIYPWVGSEVAMVCHDSNKNGEMQAGFFGGP